MRRPVLAVALLGALLPGEASAGTFSTVEPERIAAGSWYSGTTLHVGGSVGEGSQVAIRVMGPEEHRTFNRRGKIGGLIWGGVEHVGFEHAPSRYAVFTSAALGAIARPAVREQLLLGYDLQHLVVDREQRPEEAVLRVHPLDLVLRTWPSSRRSRRGPRSVTRACGWGSVRSSTAPPTWSGS